MRNLEDAPVKEGSYTSRNRSSCRTPMQWDDSPNAGFSTADASRLYLPIDPSPARPTVAAEERDSRFSTTSKGSSPCAARHRRSARRAHGAS
mgnify:CR=1 FL=1